MNYTISSPSALAPDGPNQPVHDSRPRHRHPRPPPILPEFYVENDDVKCMEIAREMRVTCEAQRVESPACRSVGDVGRSMDRLKNLI
jgi:hypothetical protein